MKLKNTDKKLDVVKNFNKLFILRGDIKDDIIPEEKLKGFIDPAQVCMIIPLKRNFETVLIKMFDVTEAKIPSTDYSQKASQGGIYSCEYLKIILELCKHYESIKIKSLEDYPLTVETNDFRIILAPRIGGLK